MLKLYSYFRSSASYRVRIALHWKELPFEYLPIHLVRDGGWQNKPEYRAVNPMGHVPALEHDGFLLTESLAIIDYLDGISPYRRLIPTAPRERAEVMELCELINAGVQPLQNLKVHKELESVYGLSKEDVKRWTQKWMTEGFTSFEKILQKRAGSFCVGGEVSAADCVLVPQCLAARRFGVVVENYPLIARIEANCLKLPAFEKAHPARQVDAE